MEPRYLTVEEVADRFRSSTQSVRRWISANKLRAIRSPGGQLLIPVEAVEALEAIPAHGSEDTEGGVA